jgi:hypothetical protein
MGNIGNFAAPLRKENIRNVLDSFTSDIRHF